VAGHFGVVGWITDLAFYWMLVSFCPARHPEISRKAVNACWCMQLDSSQLFRIVQ
jgi:hypothetical protein